MNLAEFQGLADIHGTEPSAWPEPYRGAAQRLLASEPAAQAFLARTRRLEDLIRRGLQAGSDSDEAAAARVLRVVAGELPRQRRFAFAWPAALLDVDLAPSRLRLAALGAIAVLGVLSGLLGPDIGGGDGGFMVAAAPSETTLAAMFEPEPLTGVRP